MEKVFKIRWTPIAANDFEDIVDWLIISWNEEIAHGFTKAVFGKLDRLCIFPNLGSQSNYLKGCRKTLVGPYHIILYKVFDDTIEVIRVFDGRRDPLQIYSGK